MALNRELLGKTHRTTAPFEVSAAAVRAYALATNTENPAYLQGLDGQAPLAPPIFNVAVSRLMMERAITDPELGADVARLLHAEQAMRFHRPLQVGDRLSATAELCFFDDSRTGELFDLAVRTERADGTRVYEARVSLFVRAEARRPSSELLGPIGAAPTPAARPARDAERLFETEVAVAEDQALRYSEASGDMNPIHRDAEFARSVGLPGCILHGLCTLAMAQNAVVDALAGGDPRRLGALRGKFTRPVLLGDTLTVRGQRIAGHDGLLQLGFEVCNQAGKAVIKDGVAEVRDV